MKRAAVSVLALGALALVVVVRAALFYGGADRLAFGLVGLIGCGVVAGTVELFGRVLRAARLSRELASMPRSPTLAAVNGASPSLAAMLRLRLAGVASPGPAAAWTPYLLGLLVMVGLLGTFLGLFETLRGAREALAAGGHDVDVLRSGLVAPMQGLSRAFGTSAAGVASSAVLGLAGVVARRAEGAFALAFAAYVAGPLAPLTRPARELAALETMAAQGQVLPDVAAKLSRAAEGLASLQDVLLANQSAQTAGFEARVEDVCARLTGTVARATASNMETLAQAAERTQLAVAEASRGALAAATDGAKGLREAVVEALAAAQTSLAAFAERTAAAVRAESEASHAALKITQGTLLASATGVAESLTAMSSQMSESLSLTSSQTSASLTATSSRMSESLASMSSQIAESLDATSSRMSESLTSTTAQISESLTSMASQTSESMSATSSRMSESLASMSSRMLASLTATSSQISESLHASSERTTELIATMAERVQQLVELGTEESRESVQCASRETSGALTQLAQQTLAGVDVAARGVLDRLTLAADQSLAALASSGDRSLAVVGDAAERVHAALHATTESSGRAVASLAEALTQGLERTAAQLPALIDKGVLPRVDACLVQLAEQQGEHLATWTQTLDANETARGVRAESLVTLVENLARNSSDAMASQMVSMGGQLGTLADGALGASVDLAATAQAFGDAVDRYRASTDAFFATLAELDTTTERSAREQAAEVVDVFVERTREAFEQSTALQRELFAELRAFRRTAVGSGAPPPMVEGAPAELESA